jgi:hypothetical protein
MRVSQIVAGLGVLGFMVGTAGSAAAAALADPKVLIGKWVERFSNGNGMATDFTATTLVSYPVDASLRATSAPPKPSAVTYHALDAQMIRIDFEGGGGILVLIKDAKTIVLDFPGMGSHSLVKVNP